MYYIHTVMVDFTCLTCSLTLCEPEMQEHLSSTRHNTVIHNPSKKVIKCGKCHDFNIHQLIIVQYDYSGNATLCQTCFANEDRIPSDQHTLKSGLFLKYVEGLHRQAIRDQISTVSNDLSLEKSGLIGDENQNSDWHSLSADIKHLSIDELDDGNVKANTRKKPSKTSIENTTKDTNRSKRHNKSVNKDDSKSSSSKSKWGFQGINKGSQTSGNSLNNHEEYEHIPKFSSIQPKLTYENIADYLREMYYHLYLEESLQPLHITNFQIEKDFDDPELLNISLPYTEEIKKLVPEKMRNKGMLPFGKSQSIFAAKLNNDDKCEIWDFVVKKVKIDKTENRIIELKVELRQWNHTRSFPIGLNTLFLLPCSVPTTRTLFSMTKIDESKFTKLLLGKEQISQIHFKSPLQFSKSTLNNSQKIAIQDAIYNSITVLQGPPGTGKTSTIYEMILQLVKNSSSYPILVVAASNVAVDNIAELFKDQKDLKVFRVVSKIKESQYNEKHHLSDICLHKLVFEALPPDLQQIALDIRFDRNPVSPEQHNKLFEKSSEITKRLVNAAKVVFATTVSAGSYQIKSIYKVPVVIMDESTQSTEASTLIPLSLRGVDKFIFVGDDKQLSSFSDIPFLEQSLFERIIKNGTYPDPLILNVQYRMNPKISKFPVKTFYNGLLQDGVTTEQRSLENVDPLVFVDYGKAYEESRVSNISRKAGDGGFTYSNRGEARLILKILKDLVFSKNIEKGKIGIITPYSAQRDLLANLIKQDVKLNPENEGIEEDVEEDTFTTKRPSTVKTIVKIMVSSIDAFQGRERDVIIFSCVRSNSNNNIGFVKDRKRLNVALTRARNSLVLVGNKTCMAKGDKLWSDLVSHIDANGSSQSEATYSKKTKRSI